MKSKFLPAVCILVVALLTGCATFNEREMALIRQSGAPRVVVNKIERGDPITPPEIIALWQRGVPGSFLMRYIEDEGVDYVVSRADVARMRAAGVSARVIDALIEEGEEFASDYTPSRESEYGVSWGGSAVFGPDPYYDWW